MINEPKKFTRVLVVDDSPFVCKALSEIIHGDPQLRVVGTAANGQEAVALVAKLKPDLVTMDISMPVMDGFEATKLIMAYHPTPILIISSTIFDGGMDLVFKAMTYGALDVMNKTLIKTADGKDDSAGVLIQRIRTLSRIKVITHPLAKLQAREQGRRRVSSEPITNDQIVAIAASTGGPQALLAVLKALPKDLGCGIVIVQHISEGFDAGLVEWLDSECQLTVKLAGDGEQIQPGVAYIAPTGVQMRVTEGGRIKFTDEPARDGQKPSGTVLFESVAAAFGDRAVAVILTGMGRDGADGLKEIKRANGVVIGQDEASCVVYGMPKAAAELGAVDWVRPLDQIPGAILMALRQGQKKEVLQ
jgi:two-component system chemotaxis response regulator CheB